jgi:nitrogen fixation NifU-like protein
VPDPAVAAEERDKFRCMRMKFKNMTKETPESLQEHSQRFLEMAFRTDKCGIPTTPHGHGKRTGQCGDTIEMFVTVRDNHIESVRYQCEGCINTRACGCTVACMAEGKSIERAWEITPETIVNYLETLPGEEAHCAELAVGAFYLALNNLQKAVGS